MNEGHETQTKTKFERFVKRGHYRRLIFGTAACASPSTTLPTALQDLVETARQGVDSVAEIAGTSAAQAQAPAPAATPVPVAAADAMSVVAAQEQVLTGIYERVLPSVVHIQVTQKVDLGNMLEDLISTSPTCQTCRTCRLASLTSPTRPYSERAVLRPGRRFGVCVGHTATS